MFVIKIANRKGFTVVEALLGAAVLGVMTLGVVTVVTQINSGSAGLRGQVGSQMLRQSVNEAIGNSVTCSTRYMPAPGQGAIAAGQDFKVGFKLDDGSKLLAGNNLSNYSVGINSIVLRNPTSLGPDPCDPNGTLYTGALVVSEQKLASSGAIDGGTGLRNETLGNLAISVSNSTNAVTRCTSGSPTDICDPCIVLGGTYNPATTPHCTMKAQFPCQPNTIFEGYAAGNPICQTYSVCPANQTMVSNGTGGFYCENISGLLPAVSPSPSASPVASPSPSPGTSPSASPSPIPSPSPSPAATAVPSPRPSPRICPAFQTFASRIGSTGGSTGVSIVHTACNNFIAGNTYTPIPGAQNYGSAGPSDDYVVLSSFDLTGNWLWSSEYSQTNANPQVGNVVQDTAGNFYVVGSVSCQLSSSCSFGGTVIGTSNLGPTGASNAYLMQFSPTGVPGWIVQLGAGTSPLNIGTTGISIAIDSTNNLYIAGSTEGLLGGGVYNAHGQLDAYIAKFDSSGNKIFISQIGVSNNAQQVTGLGLSLDSAGNIVLSGSAKNSSFPGAIKSICSYWGDTAYVAKFTSLGALTWVSQVGPADNIGLGNVIDSAGNIYVPLTTDCLMPGSQSGSGAFSSTDIAFFKFSSSGTYLPSFEYGQNAMNSADFILDSQGGSNIAIDSSQNIYLVSQLNRIYLGGTCYGTYCSSGLSTAVVKVKPSRTLGWVTQFSSGAWNSSVDIATDPSSNVYVTTSTNQNIGTQYLGAANPVNSLFVTSISAGAAIPLQPDPTPTPSNSGGTVQTGSSGQTTEALSIFQDTASHLLATANNNFESGFTTADFTSMTGLTTGQMEVHGSQDGYISSAMPNGSLNWIFQYGAGADTVTTGRTIYQDPDFFDLWVAGDSNGIFTVNAVVTNHGAQDLFIGWANVSGYFKFISQLGAGAGSHLYGYGFTQNPSNYNIAVGKTDTALTCGGGACTVTGVRGNTDGIMTYFDGSGNFQWAYDIGGGAGTDTSEQAIVSDQTSPSIPTYAVGTTSGAVGTQHGTHGVSDAFIVSYTGAGTYQWASQIGVVGATTTGMGIALYNSMLYIVGTTSGNLGGTQVGAHGLNDLFVAQYDTSGNFQWVTQIGVTLGSIYGTNIALDRTGSIYVTGYTPNVIPQAIQTGTHGLEDAVVAKFDTLGNFSWIGQIGVTGAITQGLGITYMYSAGTNQFGTNPPNGMVAGFTSGVLSGGTQVGTHGNDDMLLFRMKPGGIMP